MRRLLLPFLVLVALSGCATTLYSPNMAPVPLLRQQGQFHATLGNENLQLAYAPIEGLTVFANGFHSYGSVTVGDSATWHRGGWMVEAGAGPHGALLNPNLRWEVLLGGGGGIAEGRNTDSSPSSYSATGYRGFLQPNLGFVTPWFEVAGSVRLSGLKLQNATTTGAEFDPAAMNDPLHFFAEPAVTAKVGYKWVKLFFQRGWSFQLTGAEVPAKNDFVTIGVAVDLGSWFDTFQWTQPVELAE